MRHVHKISKESIPQTASFGVTDKGGCKTLPGNEILPCKSTVKGGNIYYPN